MGFHGQAHRGQGQRRWGFHAFVAASALAVVALTTVPAHVRSVEDAVPH